MNDLQLFSHIEKGLSALVQTINVSNEDIGRKGKNMKSVGIELLDGKVIKSLQEGESYKYLEILTADRFLGKEMKSKLNGGNSVQRNNAWAASLLRYLAAFIHWRKCELEVIDSKT